MNNKKIILVLVGVIVFIGVVFAFKFYNDSAKDRWVCSNGAWVRVGSPHTSQPRTDCPG